MQQDLEVFDTSVLDTSPDTGTAIDLVKNAIEWTRSRSLSFWAKSLFGVGAIASISAVFFVMNDSPKQELAGKRFDNSLYMSQTSPEMFAGITPDTPPIEIIQRLQKGVTEYDKLLGQETTKMWQDAYINESHRLLEYAKVEANSGQFLITSPFPAIDLNKCPSLLGNVERCVLFRMQLEGLNTFWEGAKATDLGSMMRGYARYKAASIALNPPGKVAIDSDRLVSGLIKQVKANYTIQQAIAPASTNPSLQLRTVPGDVQTLQDDRNQLPGIVP